MGIGIANVRRIKDVCTIVETPLTRGMFNVFWNRRRWNKISLRPIDFRIVDNVHSAIPLPPEESRIEGVGAFANPQSSIGSLK